MVAQLKNLDPLDPVLDRWLIEAVCLMSSSTVAREAAIAWIAAYERGLALGLGDAVSRGRADAAYGRALSEAGPP
jgi:hypothetical protein